MCARRPPPPRYRSRLRLRCGPLPGSAPARKTISWRNGRARAAPPPGSAYDAAVRLLASRAHSARELRVKLARRGHPADEVGATLERLRAAGYLDDVAYARALIGRRSSSRGTRAMAAELAAKGVDREVAQAALGEIESADEVAAAVDVARRMQRAGPTDPQRIGTRLLRRGFSMETARAALRQL